MTNIVLLRMGYNCILGAGIVFAGFSSLSIWVRAFIPEFVVKKCALVAVEVAARDVMKVNTARILMHSNIALYLTPVLQ